MLAVGAEPPVRSGPASGAGQVVVSAGSAVFGPSTRAELTVEVVGDDEGRALDTGWQHHTIRGAISGALKKKLGLTVEATRTREVGPEKTGAKGSSIVYRITG